MTSGRGESGGEASFMSYFQSDTIKASAAPPAPPAAASASAAAAASTAGLEQPPALPPHETEPKGPLQEQLAMLQAQFESDFAELKRAYDMERERVIQTFGGGN